MFWIVRLLVTAPSYGVRRWASYRSYGFVCSNHAINHSQFSFTIQIIIPLYNGYLIHLIVSYEDAIPIHRCFIIGLSRTTKEQTTAGHGYILSVYTVDPYRRANAAISWENHGKIFLRFKTRDIIISWADASMRIYNIYSVGNKYYKYFPCNVPTLM